MHDVLEGTARFIIKFILKSFIDEKCINMQEINNRIPSFNYGLFEKNKVPGAVNLN